MKAVRRLEALFVAACLVCAPQLVRSAAAQIVSEEPLLPLSPPPEVWKGSLAAGLALTSGNTDTSTVNASYELVRDAKGRLVFKSSGLYIRGDRDSERTVDRTSADVRLDYRITERLTTFGQLTYLRDHFKQLKFSLAPTLGFGYAVIDNDKSQLIFDSSVGAVFERHLVPDVPEVPLDPEAPVLPPDGESGTPRPDPGMDTGMRRRRGTTTNAAYALGQRLTQQVTEHARCTQAFTALWKLDDFGDALYTASAGIAASISKRSELKAEVLNTITTEPASPELEKGDVSVLMSVVYKF